MIELAPLVKELPEVYQPIYGHPELSENVSCLCTDRLGQILKVHNAFQKVLGRPLRVLDLGCAQGFFSLNLAKLGAVVHGVDYLDKNIAVCEALADECPQLEVTFEIGRVEDILVHLEMDHYDIVLGLSVFHHIVHEKGVNAVKALIDTTAECSGVLIVELALQEEPLYWGSSQSEQPRTLLEGCAFVHELARHKTHLAPIPRPLYVASNHYWVFDGHAGKFQSWTTDPHAIARGTHQSSRRYFFSPDCIVKLFRFDHVRGHKNREEILRETAFLENLPEGFSAPSLITSGTNDYEGWVASEKLPGRLLVDLLREGKKIDCRVILISVLEQLSALEAAGLYHDDVRTWNILITEKGKVQLIDFGSISCVAKDCVWPENIFLAFFIFVSELSTGIVEDYDPFRTVSISPFGLPQPYRSWATTLWHRPLSEWSFQLMHETFLQTPVDMPDELPQQPIEAWMKATEESIQLQKLFVKHVDQRTEAKAQQAETKAQEAQTIAQKAERHSRQAKDNAQKAKEQAEQAETKAQEACARAQRAETLAEKTAAAHAAIYNSRSWRITAPLRWAGNTARWFLRGSIAWLPFKCKCRPRKIARSALIYIKSSIFARPR